MREGKISAGPANKRNVVIVLMESMSAAKMSRNGNPDRLTPFLDSLTTQGCYFENAYSAGIHTYNGIFSTLFSFPALFHRHPMKGCSMDKYRGIASTLKSNNYSTIYFTTHDGQFDNVEGFLKANDFERVVSQKDYPSGSVKTTLGVPDDFMFRFSIPILNDLSKKNKPFLATMLTTSDHGPYYIPEYFKPRQKEIKKQAVEYADYSLKQFMRLASQQPWFSNTIFVFVADHGAAMSIVYDLSLDYNHVPLLFYAPHILKEKKTFSQMAGQIDIFPTIMGLLNIPYKNNTLGINLFKEQRPYIIFNADDKFGVIDSTWLLIEHKDKSAKLYQYRHNDPKDYAGQKPDIVTRMRTYGESNLQTYQYILTKKKM
jgi:phosphoglycerol transferase MdoB-like AlkP superfamily enzyme